MFKKSIKQKKTYEKQETVPNLKCLIENLCRKVVQIKKRRFSVLVRVRGQKFANKQFKNNFATLSRLIGAYRVRARI